MKATYPFLFYAEVNLLLEKFNTMLESMEALAVDNEGLDTEVQKSQSYTRVSSPECRTKLLHKV
jgi:hypothetical protein